MRRSSQPFNLLAGLCLMMGESERERVRETTMERREKIARHLAEEGRRAASQWSPRRSTSL